MKVDGIKKEVNKKLPNLTAALRKELGSWQNEEGFPFRWVVMVLWSFVFSHY